MPYYVKYLSHRGLGYRHGWHVYRGDRVVVADLTSVDAQRWCALLNAAFADGVAAAGAP